MGAFRDTGPSRETRPVDPGKLEHRRLGEFVLGERLGRGGFGEIYNARQPKLDRDAVVKVLRSKRSYDRGQAQQFVREAQLASRLQHPYAAHMYSFGAEPDGILWIAMERVQGVPMHTLLREHGPIDLPRLVPLLEKICEVVQEAHDQGIVHCDLKPSNVMIMTRAGRLFPKLLDFGIARLQHESAEERSDGNPTIEEALRESGDETLDNTFGETSATRQLLGSPYYAAPEQWTHGSIDTRTDLYALGALAFEALTGKVLFKGRTMVEIRKAHLNGVRFDLGDGFPQALTDVLRWAVAKAPEARYSDALEFARAFRDAAGISAETGSVVVLDEPLRTGLISGAPQPIADATAALEAATSIKGAVQAADKLILTYARYVGILALAARARVGSGDNDDSPEAIDWVKKLFRRDLGAWEWSQLAGAFCAPFHANRDAHPTPELVSLFVRADGTRQNPFEFLIQMDMSVTADDQAELLSERLVQIASLTKQLSFTARYPLVVLNRGRAESWMGLRRGERAVANASAASLDEGVPTIVDPHGFPALKLDPLMQIAKPSPETPDEVFLVAGRGRNGARLLGGTRSFVRDDPEVWKWFGQHIMPGGDHLEVLKIANRAPYLGLQSFSAQDSDLFFGREREAEAFLNRLMLHGLLAVVGPSGAGKSSFIQAGVIPMLSDWHCFTLRPGRDPLATLRNELSARVDVDVDWSSPRALLRVLRNIAQDQAANVLLVIDQFEELFTLSREDHDIYAEYLAEVDKENDERVRVVVTLRDDFLAHAERLSALRGRLVSSMQFVTTPDRADLIRILEEPARQASYAFENEGMVQSMVDEVLDHPGALALLSFTAAKLWSLRDREYQLLTQRAYDSLGGVGGALARHAEDMIAGMSDEEAGLVREAFRHLLTSQGTRAVLTRKELEDVLGGGAVATSAVEKLIQARLLVAAEDEDGNDRIEIIHEALVNGWPRLVQWRQEDAEGARLRDQLREAARQWHDRGRPKGLLWRGEALAEYRIWRSRFPGNLTGVENAFGGASEQDAARRKRVRRVVGSVFMVGLIATSLVLWRMNMTAERERSRADANAAEVEEKFIAQLRARGRDALHADQHMKALAFLNEAYQRGNDDPSLHFMIGMATQTLEAHKAVLRGHQSAVGFLDISKSGRLAASASSDGSIRIWELESGREVRHVDAGSPVAQVLISNDEKYVASTTTEHDVLMYRISDGHRVAKLSEPGCKMPGWGRGLIEARDGVVAVRQCGTAVSVLRVRDRTNVAALDIGTTKTSSRLAHDQKGQVVVGLDSGEIALFDLNTGNSEIRRIGTTAVKSVTFSQRTLFAGMASGDLLVISPQRDVKRWPAGQGPIDRLSVDPSGTYVATAALNESNVSIWRVADGLRVSRTRDHGCAVRVVSYLDNQTLATGGCGGAVYLWDTRSGIKLATLQGHHGAVYSLAYDVNAQRLVSGAINLSVWELDKLPLLRVLDDYNKASGFLSDGRAYISNAKGDVTIGAPALGFRSGTGVTSIKLPGTLFALSDDAQLAVVEIGGDAVLWDVGKMRRVESLQKSSAEYDRYVFSKDGRSIYGASRAGATVTRWAISGEMVQVARTEPRSSPPVLALSDAFEKGLLATHGHGAAWWPNGPSADNEPVIIGPIGSSVFSLSAVKAADGRELWATGHANKSIVLWQPQPLRQVATLLGHDSIVGGVTGLRNGLLASSSLDGTIRIWNSDAGTSLAAFRYAYPPEELVVDPAGAWLLSQSYVRTVLRELPKRKYSRSALAEIVQCDGLYVLRNERIVPNEPSCN